MTYKEQLRSELIEILTTQRQNALAAADSAHDDATHEQSVAETQYDTVGLEAAYLAHGQSQRVADCDMMINRIKRLA
ncbi:transcription elongation factor [Vibrio ishigakensis]|uniref:Transcription elongation factor n=1 Tax=Vibrio ishigakensis TaxID=1481914 RepID=A0A0B8P521_9VIBR|nr:transcription elongation factor [Vibrio ishigakensis]